MCSVPMYMVHVCIKVLCRPDNVLVAHAGGTLLTRMYRCACLNARVGRLWLSVARAPHGSPRIVFRSPLSSVRSSAFLLGSIFRSNVARTRHLQLQHITARTVMTEALSTCCRNRLLCCAASLALSLEFLTVCPKNWRWQAMQPECRHG